MIIVYGGTFNPPTIAHQKIAKHILSVFKPEKMIILPVGDSYTRKDTFVSFKDRFKMLQLAFRDPIFEISTLENSSSYKGTYEALKYIKNTYKTSVYFLLGADNLNYLDQWINYQALIKEFHFIVLQRKGYPLEEIIQKYHPYEDRFNVVLMDISISSSLFRSDKEKYSHFVCEEVYTYIKENHLYEV